VCDLAIVIAFAHSNCLMKAAAAAYFVLQLDVIIVALSSSCGANAAIWLDDWVGYNEAVGHTLFNLISNFTAPHHQANGYTILCIAKRIPRLFVLHVVCPCESVLVTLFLSCANFRRQIHMRSIRFGWRSTSFCWSTL